MSDEFIMEVAQVSRERLNEIKDEMTYLARTLKFKIRTLIEQNYCDQALQTIQQLESFIGEDEELKLLKDQALLK